MRNFLSSNIDDSILILLILYIMKFLYSKYLFTNIEINMFIEIIYSINIKNIKIRNSYIFYKRKYKPQI